MTPPDGGGSPFTPLLIELAANWPSQYITNGDIDIRLLDGKVSIRVDNAKAGVRYGYKFAERLQDVDKAEVIWLDGAAAADGVLTLDIDRTTPSGFFRLVAE